MGTLAVYLGCHVPQDADLEEALVGGGGGEGRALLGHGQPDREAEVDQHRVVVGVEHHVALLVRVRVRVSITLLSWRPSVVSGQW